MANIEENVEHLIKDKIEKIGYELYDVEYTKEGKNYYLRIFIDNEKGINLEDCEKVSNEINEILDQEDYIKEQYFLEVSSPGIERNLRKDEHLKKYIGEEVEVKMFKKDEKGKKQIRGILEDFTQNYITIDGKQINRKDIAQIKTIYNW